MGAEFQEKGLTVSTNYSWVDNINSDSSLKSFFERAARWAVMRFNLRKKWYIAEILLNPLFFSLLLIPEYGFFQFFIIAAAKIALEYLNFIFINVEDRKKLRMHLYFPFAVIVKDIILFLVYLYPFFSGSVKWRGRNITIGKNTRIISGNKESVGALDA